MFIRTTTEILDDSGNRLVDPVIHLDEINIAVAAGAIMPYSDSEQYEPGDTVLTDSGDTYVCVSSKRIMGVEPGNSQLWRLTTAGRNKPVETPQTAAHVPSQPAQSVAPPLLFPDPASHLARLRSGSEAPAAQASGRIEALVDEDQADEMRRMYPEMLGDPRRMTQSQIPVPERDAAGNFVFRSSRRSSTEAATPAPNRPGETPASTDDDINFRNVQPMG